MLARSRWLGKMPSQISPLRYHSFVASAHRFNVTPRTPHQPNRGLFTESACIITTLAIAARVLETKEGNPNDPQVWPVCVGLTLLIGYFEQQEKKQDAYNNKVEKCERAIFDAKANRDENALPTLFKELLSNDQNTSEDFFILVTVARQTNTLGILLDSTKTLRDEQVNKLFAAMKKHGTVDACNLFLEQARCKNVFVRETAAAPGMRMR